MCVNNFSAVVTFNNYISCQHDRKMFCCEYSVIFEFLYFIGKTLQSLPTTALQWTISQWKPALVWHYITVETSSGMTLYHSGNQLWYDTISQWKPALVSYISADLTLYHSGNQLWYDTISQWKPAGSGIIHFCWFDTILWIESLLSSAGWAF